MTAKTDVKLSDRHVDMNAQHETIKCEVCLIEIPATIAKTFDGPTYVHYFCGLDCLGKWQEQLIKTGGDGNPADPL